MDIQPGKLKSEVRRDWAHQLLWICLPPAMKTDAAAGLGGHHASRVLCRLAKCLLGATRRKGCFRKAGRPVKVIRPGDVVWCPPGEKHWHGATPTTAMTHIALQEELNGKVVDWMEKVSDEQYRRDADAR